jgi:L-ascorbate metabolism protein UlaG (beta-lactamase superfamily)
MSFQMRWLGTACFEIVLPNGMRIVTDPYLDDSVSAPISSDGIRGCSCIFITHGHFDHLLDAGKLASRFRPRIFCNEAAARSLAQHQGVDDELITRITAGDTIHEAGLAVEVLRGVHVDFLSEYRRITGTELLDGTTDMDAAIRKGLREILGTDQVPPKFREWMEKYPPGEQLNFVFDPVGGKRIYMAGSYPDPGLIEVAKHAKAHITLLQVLPGKSLNGLEEQTACFAVASGCSIAVPQHHDPLLAGAATPNLSRLRQILARSGQIVFQEFMPGRWYTYD